MQYLIETNRVAIREKCENSNGATRYPNQCSVQPIITPSNGLLTRSERKIITGLQRLFNPCTGLELF